MPLPLAVAELLAPRGAPLPLQVGVAEAPAGPVLPTGIPGLDAAAPGGVPRGRLTEVVARRGGGRTTLLRQLVERTVAAGGWVAVVDAGRTLAPRDWAPAGESGRLWVVRPENAARAAWCADVLLRSGAFALVVLDAAPPLSRAVAVRLTRLARETGAALVVAGETGSGAGTTQLPGALRLRVSAIRPRESRSHSSQPQERGWRLNERMRAGTTRRRKSSPHPPSSDLPAHIRVPVVHEAANTDEDRHRAREHEVVIAVLVEKGGIHRTVEVSCAIDMSRRLCAHPEIPDRRGVARRPAGRVAPRADGHGAAAARARDAAIEHRAPSTEFRRHSPFVTNRGRPRVATPDYPTAARGRAGALG